MKYLFYGGFYCCMAVMMLCSCSGRNNGSDNDTEIADSAYDVSDEMQETVILQRIWMLLPLVA